MQIDAYLLDWNVSRPFGGGVVTDAIAAFKAGRYEYSFTLPELPNVDDLRLCEHAYLKQGNGGTKIRQDRQTMSIGDVVVVRGLGTPSRRAYVCDTFGFTRVPELDRVLETRLDESWERWTTTPTEVLS